MTIEDAIALRDLRVQTASGAARMLREAAGLSQGEVADAVGVSHVTVHRWETGESTPKGKAALRYKELLDALSSRRGVRPR